MDIAVAGVREAGEISISGVEVPDTLSLAASAQVPEKYDGVVPEDEEIQLDFSHPATPVFTQTSLAVEAMLVDEVHPASTVEHDPITDPRQNVGGG